MKWINKVAALTSSGFWIFLKPEWKPLERMESTRHNSCCIRNIRLKAPYIFTIFPGTKCSLIFSPVFRAQNVPFPLMPRSVPVFTELGLLGPCQLVLVLGSQTKAFWKAQPCCCLARNASAATSSAAVFPVTQRNGAYLWLRACG